MTRAAAARLRRAWNRARRRARAGLRWSSAHPVIEGQTVGSVAAEFATWSSWRLFHGAPPPGES